MHLQALALPGRVETLAEGRALPNSDGKLYRYHSVDGDAHYYHVIYDFPTSQQAESYLAEHLPRISEHARLVLQDDKRWYVQPQLPLATNSADGSQLLSRMRAALVVWQADALLHKVFVSSLDGDEVALRKQCRDVIHK